MIIRQFTDNIPVLVNAKEIDESPGSFTMSFGFDLKPLIRSIEKFGLINTPYVVRDTKGKWVPVVGFRRILVLKSLQWKKIPCVDLSDLGLSVLDLILLNLHDNLTTRKFNDVEKGMILYRLTPHTIRDEMLNYYMPLLDLPSHEPTLDLFLKLEELDTIIKRSIAEGTVSLKTIKQILDMSYESCMSILTWLNKIKFNFNQQLQFIEYIEDISIKEEKSITQILEEKQLLKLLEDTKLNNPQKTKHVLNLLRSIRFPRLTDSEKTFQKNISRLSLPKDVRIQHPPYFEAPHYRLEILFKNGKELKEKIGFLSNLDHLQMVGDPWETDL